MPAINPLEPEDNAGDAPDAVPCPMCQGNCKVQYRIGASRVWEARYRSKTVDCPLCLGKGFWLFGAWIALDIPANQN